MTDFAAADAGIRQLHGRFADAVWRQDDAEFAACFASEGVWKIAGMEFTGREQIADACRRMLGRCSHIHLITGLPILEVDGGTAKGRLSLTEFARMQDGTTAMTIGWYHDSYVEEDGRWCFARRHWSMKYRGAPDLTGHFAGTPNYGAFPSAPAEDEATYVRPAGQ
ncbi:MAG: nuclear transport factor 2 family protein [Novosphingobium sp.]|nr:nuclear transport factor 2 family protein [Novosphingobium sp.]